MTGYQVMKWLPGDWLVVTRLCYVLLWGLVAGYGVM